MCVCVSMRAHTSICCSTQRGGPCQDVLHQQLEETNCVADTGAGHSPSLCPAHSTGPNHSAIIWCGEPQRPPQSLPTRDVLSEDTRGELTVRAATSKEGGWKKIKIRGLEKLQDYKANAIIQFLGHSASVCVSHLSLVCGGGWVRWEILDTPAASRHLPHKSSVPLSLPFSFHSPTGDTLSPQPFMGRAARSLLYFSSLLFSVCFHGFAPSISSHRCCHPRHPPSCYSSSLEVFSARLSGDKTLRYFGRWLTPRYALGNKVRRCLSWGEEQCNMFSGLDFYSVCDMFNISTQHTHQHKAQVFVFSKLDSLKFIFVEKSPDCGVPHLPRIPVTGKS